jgi:hypothetical protein
MPLTESQTELVEWMQGGWSLESYRMIGTGRVFTLKHGSDTRFADKRTVNSLLKRGVIVFCKKEGKFAYSSTSYWSLDRSKL